MTLLPPDTKRLRTGHCTHQRDHPPCSYKNSLCHECGTHFASTLCNQSLIASSFAAILLCSSRGTTSCTPGSSSLSNSFCFASFAASSQEFSLLGHLGVRHLSTPSSRVASGLDQDPWTASLAHGFLVSGSKRTLSTWPVLDLDAPSAALLLTNASLATAFSTLAVRPAMSCASLVPLLCNLYLKFGLSGLTFLFACRSTSRHA